jgi:hypothetical protein
MAIYTYKDFSTLLDKPHKISTGYKLENDFYFDERDDILLVSAQDTIYRDGNLAEIYPNPSNGEFHFMLKELDAEDVVLEVYSLSGVLLHAERIDYLTKLSPVYMNLGYLPKGIYIFSFSAFNHELERKKLILH